jgi:hypothetical protein
MLLAIDQYEYPHGSTYRNHLSQVPIAVRYVYLVVSC